MTIVWQKLDGNFFCLIQIYKTSKRMWRYPYLHIHGFQKSSSKLRCEYPARNFNPFSFSTWLRLAKDCFLVDRRWRFDEFFFIVFNCRELSDDDRISFWRLCLWLNLILKNLSSSHLRPVCWTDSGDEIRRSLLLIGISMGTISGSRTHFLISLKIYRQTWNIAIRNINKKAKETPTV